MSFMIFPKVGQSWLFDSIHRGFTILTEALSKSLKHGKSCGITCFLKIQAEVVRISHSSGQV
jgi:hypothetical protein